MQPFAGVRVLDLTHVFAGPFCAYQLGVMGAEVIKIEPPHSPDMTRPTGARADLNDTGMGLGFQGQGGGKKAIALDLAAPEGRALFHQMVAGADVVVQNYTTDCLTRLGLDYETLKQINPALVYCSISGYGRTGPKASHPAYDVVIQAFAGVMASNGEAGSPPVRIGPAVIDYGTGAQAAFAVAAALYRRAMTGEGAYIDVAMADCALMLMTSHVVTTLGSGTAPQPFGNQDPGLASYSAYDTAEGTLMLGAYTPKQAAALFRFLGDEEEAAIVDALSPMDMAPRRDRQAAFLTRVLATRTAQEWEDALNAAHIPAARVRTLDEALTHPQFTDRDVLQSVPEAAGVDTLPVTGFRLHPDGANLGGPPPAFGQDTDRVLLDLGLTTDTITDLRARRIVA